MSTRFFNSFFIKISAVTWILCALVNPLDSLAQKIKFVHKPVTEMPPPGHPLPISVELDGIKDSERNVKVFLVKDGKSMIVPLEGHLNEFDASIYVASTTAPLAQIYYQFILTNPDGTIVSSQRFEITRKCIPDITLTDVVTRIDASESELAQDLVNKTKRLENEIAQLQSIISTIDVLKKELHVDESR